MDWRINVYGYDKFYTKHSQVFEVIRRTRPDDYVYTDNQIKTWDALEERVAAIEETGAADLNDYYTKEEVDNALASVEVDLTDYYTKEETDALIPSTSGLATEKYVDEKFNSIEIPEAESGVYVGVEEPTDDSVVWINPEGDGVSLEQIVQEAVDAAVGDVDLSEYAKKTDIPDTTGFITMPEVEDKGYQTEEEVRAIVAEGGGSGGDVFIGAGMPSVSAEVVEGSVGWTAVSIKDEGVLMSKLTKGPGDYYIGTNSGGAFEYLRYGSMTGTSVASYHLGTLESNLGLTTTGNYSDGYNWIKISYSTGDAGKEGLVPAPAEGSQDKMWLNSSGEWRIKMPMAGAGANSEVFNDVRSFANGQFAHAEGIWVDANGLGSHAEGINTETTGYGAHAEGAPINWSTSVSYQLTGPLASGRGAHAEGAGVACAYGDGSHVEGYHQTSGQAHGNGAHMEGYSYGIYARVYGSGAHVEGYNNTTDTNSSNGVHIEGGYNYSRTPYQHVQGKYCIKDVDGTYADIVGNGTADSDTARSNAYTLDWSGNATFAGTITSASGADYAEYFEWLDGNPEDEDRVGYIVKLNGDKIEFANADDDVLGVISGTMTVLGDNAEWYWQGKYLTDDFGRIIYEDKVEWGMVSNPETGEEEEAIIAIYPAPKLNPNYDADMPYENRSIRPEWDAVGMMGKLYVRDDGTAEVNGYVVANNGIATASGNRTNMRVMARVSENIIRVCLK